MGQCCMQQNAPYEKPSQHQSNESLDKNDISDMNPTMSVSPTSLSSNTKQPMLGSKKTGKTFTNGSNTANETIISQMALCDEETTALCQNSLKLIQSLSIYHLFIHNYPQTNSKEYICDMIYNQMTEYSVIQLRNDSHHVLSYHEDNRKFMKSLYRKLMELNEQNGIENLRDITLKMDEDQQKRYYFGHTNDEETQMIQTLNQIHHDITYSYAHGSDQDEEDGSMNSFAAGDSMNEIDEDSDSMNTINDDDENRNMMDDDMDDMEENSVNLTESDEDSENKKIKITRNKNEKRGYSQSSTVDHDDEEDLEIGVSFKVSEKKKNKIGRLKLKKKLEEDEDCQGNKGKMKIKDDTSWMDKSQRKKKKHVASESIQMLGTTKLVSNNSFKDVGIMDILQENEFDLTGFNADGIDLDDD